MVTERRLTVAMLRKWRGCESEVSRFEREFGKWATICAANIYRAAELHFDLEFFASHYLEAPLWEQYKKARAPLWEQYKKARAPLWEQYKKAEAALWEQYKKVETPLREQYEKAEAQLWEQYVKAVAQLWEQYVKAEAQLLVTLMSLGGDNK